MNIDYWLFNPNNNITILVETPVKTELQPLVASYLMKAEPTAEQVGFVCENGFRMAGGEFCGNASICYASLLNANIPVGSKISDAYAVSGVGNKVNISIEKFAENEFSAVVEMPQPKEISKVFLPYKRRFFRFDAVIFNGITHIILDETYEKSFCEEVIKNWCDYLKCDALGLILFNCKTNDVKPLVYVKSANTCVWESSCASGATAICAFLASKTKRQVFLDLKFPGGHFGVESDEASRILLYGNVQIIKHSSLEIGEI